MVESKGKVEKSDLSLPFMTIIMLAFVIGVLLLGSIIVFQYIQERGKEVATLSVGGNAKTYVEPDKVDVYLSVETQDVSALVSQQQNAEKMKEVYDALKNVNENDIETIYYNLYPVRTYDKEGNEKLVGYRTIHKIKVSLKDINATGRIIDAAVNAGANNVDEIVFGISDERYEALKKNLTLKAIDNAKNKAREMAEQAGVKIKNVRSISEGYFSVSRLKLTTAEAETTISPGQIEVSSSINIVYEIV